MVISLALQKKQRATLATLKRIKSASSPINMLDIISLNPYQNMIIKEAIICASVGGYCTVHETAGNRAECEKSRAEAQV